jgi:long-chain acyl-CoA synthetase
VERIWLKSYPKGVPAEIDLSTYASVRDVFEESCAKFGARRAYTCMGKSITFAELDELSRAFGAYLQGKGLKKGDRVALMMPNVLQYPGARSASTRRMHCRECQSATHRAELEHQLSDSGAQIIVVVRILPPP